MHYRCTKIIQNLYIYIYIHNLQNLAVNNIGCLLAKVTIFELYMQYYTCYIHICNLPNSARNTTGSLLAKVTIISSKFCIIIIHAVLYKLYTYM